MIVLGALAEEGCHYQNGYGHDDHAEQDDDGEGTQIDDAVE